MADIDEKLDKRDLHLVKISDDDAGDEFGITEDPCLVYFENGVPELFTGVSSFSLSYMSDNADDQIKKKSK